MNWDELPVAARYAIVAAGFLLVVILIWQFLVAPLGPRAVRLQTEIDSAESQLRSMEGEIDSIPPATAGERQAWEATAEELYSRVGPEPELALLIETLVREADDQGIELYLTTAAPVTVGEAEAANRRERGQGPESRTLQVMADVDRTRYVPITARIYGDYGRIGRFVAGLSRLDWVLEIQSMTMERAFPEVLAEIGLRVYFQGAAGGDRESGQGRTIVPPTSSSGAGSSGAAGATGGR